MSKKVHSIPDCPQLSKYDGLGMAGACIMEEERKQKQINVDSIISSIEDYELGYKKGYSDAKLEFSLERSKSVINHDPMEDYKKGFIMGYESAKIDMDLGINRGGKEAYEL